MIALGDVMGHGIGAALVMAGARAVLRDRAAGGSGLAEIAGRLNHLLCADLEGSHFMTMHCSILDPDTRLFRWVSAGHDPAIIYDPAEDRFIDLPERGDYPLGIMDKVQFNERQVGPLPEGAVIVVGTDGIWEARNTHDEQFGKERLCVIIRDGTRAGKSAAELTHSIIQAVSEHRETLPQHDDVTLVVIRLTPTRSSARPGEGDGERAVFKPLAGRRITEHLRGAIGILGSIG
jgi:sigma-B regulation protein RsbU (phosphoserine phosphatase)